MKRSIAILLDEAKSKMSAFVALVNYRYMNLCVEAEPASLLCITVEMGGIKYDLEDVANVSTPRKDQFALLPKDEDPSLIFAICKAVKTSHPEFDVEVKDLNEDEEADDDNQNDNDDEEEDNKYILLTMPKVDKKRHDLINTGIDTLQKACEAKLEFIFQEYVGKATVKLATAKPEELDEAKELFKNLHDEHKKLLGEYSDDKKAQVDEAYQRYQEEQEQKQAEQQEKEEAHGRDKGMSMRMEE